MISSALQVADLATANQRNEAMLKHVRTYRMYVLSICTYTFEYMTVSIYQLFCDMKLILKQQCFNKVYTANIIM